MSNVRGGAMQTPSSKALVSSLQEAGLFMVNTLEATTDSSNKFTTAIKLKKAGIPTPNTALVTNSKSIPIALKEVGGKFPIIAKTVTGSQGIGVVKVDSHDSLTSVLEALWKHNADLILQEFIDIDFDIRTIVLNGKIIASSKRFNTKKGEFRTNKSIEGNVTKPHELSLAEKKIILKAAKISGTYYCGVDHIMVDGEPKILEINGSPGSSVKFYYYNNNHLSQKNPLLEHLLDVITNKENWDRPKKTIGVIEWVNIEGMKMKAKFDTGNWAGGTAINAENIKEVGKKVSFIFNGKKFVKPILFTKEVKDGGFGKAKIEPRHYIEMNMSTGGGIAKPTIFCLDDRSGKTYKVLVNRDWMKDNNILIDSGKKFMLGEQRKRINTFREMYV
jgi:RimK family alpha-L-glutamate ligase